MNVALMMKRAPGIPPVLRSMSFAASSSKSNRSQLASSWQLLSGFSTQTIRLTVKQWGIALQDPCCLFCGRNCQRKWLTATSFTTTAHGSPIRRVARRMGFPEPARNMQRFPEHEKPSLYTRMSSWKLGSMVTRWAPTNYKWSYKPYKWPYKWVTGVITLLIGVITPFITSRGPTL